jgi:hypothetical protein
MCDLSTMLCELLERKSLTHGQLFVVEKYGWELEIISEHGKIFYAEK